MIDLRSRLFDTGTARIDSALGELARDISEVLQSLVGFALVEFTGLYTETPPMPVGFDHEPKMMLAGRVREDAAPETAVIHWSSVCFVWSAANKTLNVTSIAGLTPGTKYRFVFLMVG